MLAFKKTVNQFVNFFVIKKNGSKILLYLYTIHKVVFLKTHQNIIAKVI